MDILKSFPFLVPIDADKTYYKGFIQVQGESFHLEIHKPAGDSSLDGTSVQCDCRLRDLLRGYDDLLKQRLKQMCSLTDFLKEMTRLLDVQLSKINQHRTSSTPQLYSKLVQEIQEIGWNRLVYIDSNFTELHLVSEDVKGRNHILKITLHGEHPRLAPKCSTELPRAFDFAWNLKSTLQDLLAQFRRSLDQYQDLWDVLDHLDQRTWILEPEKPTRADVTRRVALGNNASLQIHASVNHPMMLPECRFMGADHVIGPLKSKFNANLHLWESTEGLVENLQRILQIDFPSPKHSKKEDFSVECGICYSYRLDQEIPDQACDDPRCGQPFHGTCLYEWLRALPSFRQSFNVVFGECPYCSTPITMKMSMR